MTEARIPTVDISTFSGTRDDFVEALGRGYEEYGFLGVVGHGIQQQTIDDAYAALREFFSLSQAVKDKYKAEYGGARGYTGFGIETAKDSSHPDLKEFWQVGRELEANGANVGVGSICSDDLGPAIDALIDATGLATR